VKLKFAAHKFRADEIGNEKDIEIGDEITFGVFDAAGETLYLKKHWVNTKTGELEFVVDRLPNSSAPKLILITGARQTGKTR